MCGRCVRELRSKQEKKPEEEFDNFMASLRDTVAHFVKATHQTQL